MYNEKQNKLMRVAVIITLTLVAIATAYMCFTTISDYHSVQSLQHSKIEKKKNDKLVAAQQEDVRKKEVEARASSEVVPNTPPVKVDASTESTSRFAHMEHVERRDNDWVYTVQKGDTLTSVSAKLGFDVQDVASKNNITNLNFLSEGACLRLPA